MTLFNYGVKKGRDVGLTCTCHMRFLKGDSHCLPEHKRDRFSFLLYNNNGKTLSYKGPRQLGRITFHWRTNSERFSGFQNFDLIEGLLFSCMLNRFKPGMLRDLSLHPTWWDIATWFQFKSDSSLCKHSLLWLVWNIRAGDQCLTFIHSWNSVPWKVFNVPLLLTFFSFNGSF